MKIQKKKGRRGEGRMERDAMRRGGKQRGKGSGI
jgi:hypothetical protein